MQLDMYTYNKELIPKNDAVDQPREGHDGTGQDDGERQALRALVLNDVFL